MVSAVNFSTVAKLYNQYSQGTVLNFADHPEVSYAIPPQATQWACKRLASSSRIIPAGHSLIHKIKNALRLLVELTQLCFGRVGVINRKLAEDMLRLAPVAIRFRVDANITIGQVREARAVASEIELRGVRVEFDVPM